MDRKIGLEIRSASQKIKQNVEENRIKSGIDLTHIQARILLYISKQEKAVYQKDIEKLLHIRRSTATEILNILERDGYIIRTRASYDRRLKEIQITPSSLDIVSELDCHIDDLENSLKKDIKKEDLEIFYKVLDQVKKNIE